MKALDILGVFGVMVGGWLITNQESIGIAYTAVGLVAFFLQEIIER